MSLMGWRLDRTFTLANVIQITLIVATMFFAVFGFYNWLRDGMKDVQNGQKEMSRVIDDFIVSYRENKAEIDRRIGVNADAANILSQRINAVEQRQAIYDANQQTRDTQLSDLDAKLDSIYSLLLGSGIAQGPLRHGANQ